MAQSWVRVPTMQAQAMGRLVVVWHGRSTPTDEEWTAFLALLRMQPVGTLRGLVITDGGAPTPSQQLQIARQMGIRPIPVAVVSDSTGVRFVAGTLALVTRLIRTFATHELTAAFAHLELTADEVRSALAFITEARQSDLALPSEELDQRE